MWYDDGGWRLHALEHPDGVGRFLAARPASPSALSLNRVKVIFNDQTRMQRILRRKVTFSRIVMFVTKRVTLNLLFLNEKIDVTIRDKKT